MSAGRSLLVTLGLWGLASVPAAAQARSTIVATATVIDLSEARATVQVANRLLADAHAESQVTPAPSRRETGAASVIVSCPERMTSGIPLDPTLATIVYW
jgi:hypothetical protein